MRGNLVIAVMACLLFLGSAHAQLKLSSTIRDFRARHPNMDLPLTFDVFQFEQGIVQSTLDHDRKPVFNRDGVPFDTVTNEADFFDWYHDVPGTNLSTSYEIEFSAARNGWQFGSTSNPFRPIDGQLFGDVGSSRGNNLFTLETHAEFTYEGGEFFLVSSDDDAWLFINDHLVLDSGGIHDLQAGSQTVRLDNLGLKQGEDYAFDFFYAERARQGYLYLVTDLRLRQGPPELVGDFDWSGELDSSDIDMLSLRVRRGVGSAEFDLTGDETIDAADRDHWVRELAMTLYGDSDLNRHVEFPDFLQLTANYGKPGGWSTGDFDGSGDVGFPDFLLLADRFGQSTEAAVVPESTCDFALGFSLIIPWLLKTVRTKRSLARHSCKT